MSKLNTKKSIVVATGVTAAVASSASQAALPGGVAVAFTTLQTDVLALIDLAWPAAIAITVAFIVLRLFKKAASSAV